MGKWNIFIDKESIKKMDDGIFIAITYQDLGVLQQGIDEYDEKKNENNRQLTLKIAQKNGCRLSLQTHKFWGIN